jgi:hypothetical protein
MNAQPTNALADPDTRTGRDADTKSRVRGERSARAAGEHIGARRMPWTLLDGAAIAFFIAIAYRVTSEMWRGPTAYTPQANPTDQTFFEFMLLHAVRIFTHGENPFLTTQLNAPIGVNVMANTGLLGLSVPLAPLTAWLGPAVVYVLIIMLGLAGTATAWYYVLSRHFIGNRFGALIGAVIIGFGPGIVTHANGHPNLCAQFMLPLILWRALAMRTTARWLRDGAILGLMIAYQAFLNEELLFLTALGGTVFVLLYIPFRRSEARAAVVPMAKGLGVAAAVSGLILAYPIWYQFNGRANFAGLPSWMQDSYRLTPASFVHSPTLSWTGSHDANQWLATLTEENSFLGWFLLLTAVAAVVVCAVWTWRRNFWVVPLALVGVLFAWASWGNRVFVTTGPRGPGTELPISLWKHLNTLPIFESVLPSRLALVVLPVVGILVAALTAEAAQAVGRAIKAENPIGMLGGVAGVVVALVAAITIFPKPVPVADRPAVPEFFTSGDYKHYVVEGSTVLPGDPSDTIGSMRWAISSNLNFGVPGGYFLGPDPNKKGQYGPQFRQTMVVLWDVAKGTWSLDNDVDYWRSVAKTDLRFWDTSAIVLPVGNSSFTTLRTTISTLLNEPGQQVDDVWVWDTKSFMN